MINFSFAKVFAFSCIITAFFVLGPIGGATCLAAGIVLVYLAPNGLIQLGGLAIIALVVGIPALIMTGVIWFIVWGLNKLIAHGEALERMEMPEIKDGIQEGQFTEVK